MVVNTTFQSFTSPSTSDPNSSWADSGSGSDEIPSQEIPLKEFRYIILPLIYTIVFVVGLIGNGLVMYIMHLKAGNRSITDVYVLNLAIADFIFVAMLPLWTVAIALDWWPFGNVMCKVASGCTYFDLYASVFFITAMSVDRYIAVVHYNSCRRTLFRARVFVASIWILSGVLGVIPMAFRGTAPSAPDGLPKCGWTFNMTIHYHWFMIYTMTRSVVGFAIPLLIILFSYLSIIYFLKTRETKGKLTGKCQDHATRMVLVVIGVFLFCWLPNQVSNLVYVVQSLADTSSTMTHYYVHMFSTTLTWMHSCVNPILYAYIREDFRIKIKEICYNIKQCCGATLCFGRKQNTECVNGERSPQWTKNKKARGRFGRSTTGGEQTQLTGLTALCSRSTERISQEDNNPQKETAKESKTSELEKECLLADHNNAPVNTTAYAGILDNIEYVDEDSSERDPIISSGEENETTRSENDTQNTKCSSSQEEEKGKNLNGITAGLESNADLGMHKIE